MKAADLPTLSTRLAELADYYDRKPPSPAALRVWLDALADIRIDDVLHVLTDWPKLQRQMPLADEVLKRCRALASDRLEAQARSHRDAATTVADLDAALRRKGSPEARQAREELAGLLSRAPTSPKAWALQLRALEEAGEPLCPAQQEAWRAALRWQAEA